MEPVTTRRKGERFTRKEKQLILNVLNYFNVSHNVSVAVREASKALGCSERTIYNIKREQQIGPLTSPKKRPKRKGVQTNDRRHTYDEGTQSLIRRKVHSFFIQNVPPTLNTILVAVNNDTDLPNFTRSTLHRLLHDMDFEFKKVGRKSILIECDDIVRWRHKYLREIKKFRNEGTYIFIIGILIMFIIIVELFLGRTIIYTDESWVNTGHAVNRAWTDNTIQTSREAFTQGLSTGLKSPSGLGPRFALVHAGGENGFVPDAKYTFLCKKNTADVHHEMDADTYENWFVNQLLPNIPPQSVIVLDNASYHSRKREKIPTGTWRKNDIIEWLRTKGIPADNEMLKMDLLTCVSEIKWQYDVNKIDELASASGHVVLRLPPYHCELNPIEMVWAQVKHYVKMNNTTFKVRDMEELITQGYSNITLDNWQNYIKHVKDIEANMWKVDNLQDNIEEFIINVGQSSSSETEDYLSE